MSWWWVIGGIAGAWILLMIVFAIRDAVESARVEREGRLAFCWIVYANESLYKPKASDRPWSFAQVVFNFEPDTPANRAELQRLAAELKQFDSGPHPSGDERLIGSVMRTLVPHLRPLRLPDRITGGREAYTVSLRVAWEQLPEGRLTLPFVYCKAIVGPGRAARLAPYPPGATEAQPA